MNTKFRFYTIIAVLMFSFGLSSCGGGGGGGSDSNSNTPAPVAATYSVSGVLTQAGKPLSGVTVTMTKPSAHSAAIAVAFSGSQAETTTNENGEYSFSGLTAGDYVVTPTSDDYSFSPVSTPVTVDSNENVAAATFTAKDVTDPVVTPPVTPPVTPTNKYKISGLIGSREELGSVQGSLSGVTVTLSGSNTGATLTDSEGHYEFTVENGSYYVTPSKDGYRFRYVDSLGTETKALVNVESANQPNIDFVGSSTAAPTITVIGTVTFPEAYPGAGRAGLVGVTVTMTCLDNNNAILTATTGTGGVYRFPGLSNGRYTITAAMTGYTFTPATLSITVVDVYTGTVTGDRYFTVN